MKKDKFLNDLANNTPNSSMFEGVEDFEEDLQGGQTFTSVRKSLKSKKENKENNENI